MSRPGSRFDTDVVVVGGGAMGSAAAWQLAERGVDAVLLEQFGAGHTRGASHGASRIFRLSYPDQVHIDLAREAQQLWRQLEADAGVELLTVTGGVDHGSPAALKVLRRGLVAANVRSEWLSPREAEAIWPGIRIDTRALYHPDSGRLHADRAVAALQGRAAAGGVQVRHGARVARVEVLDDGVAVHLDGEVLRARRAVVAAGAWTPGLLTGAAPLPPLRVTQEQPAHFASSIPLTDWPAFGHHPPGAAHGVYGLATPGEGVKVGLHGAGPEVHPDTRDFRVREHLAASLAEYVRDWLPGLDPDSGAAVTCTYTTSPDSRFVLDRHGPLTVAAGFSGHGFKFVPAIGRVLADLALDGPRPDPGFAADRFEPALSAG